MPARARGRLAGEPVCEGRVGGEWRDRRASAHRGPRQQEHAGVVAIGSAWRGLPTTGRLSPAWALRCRGTRGGCRLWRFIGGLPGSTLDPGTDGVAFEAPRLALGRRGARRRLGRWGVATGSYRCIANLRLMIKIGQGNHFRLGQPCPPMQRQRGNLSGDSPNY